MGGSVIDISEIRIMVPDVEILAISGIDCLWCDIAQITTYTKPWLLYNVLYGCDLKLSIEIRILGRCILYICGTTRGEMS